MSEGTSRSRRDTEVVGTHNGRRLFSDDDQLVLADLGTRWTTPLLFGFGFFFALSCLLTLAHVPLWIVGRMPWQAAAALPTLAVVTGTAIWWLVRRRRSLHARPLDELDPIVVFDFGSGWLRLPDGSPLVALDRVVLRSRRHIRSTQHQLRVEWFDGSIPIAEEGYLPAGFAGLVDPLRARGLPLEKGSPIF